MVLFYLLFTQKLIFFHAVSRKDLKHNWYLFVVAEKSTNKHTKVFLQSQEMAPLKYQQSGNLHSSRHQKSSQTYHRTPNRDITTTVIPSIPPLERNPRHEIMLESRRVSWGVRKSCGRRTRATRDYVNVTRVTRVRRITHTHAHAHTYEYVSQWCSPSLTSVMLNTWP